MSGQLIDDGTYNVVGPGGHLTLEPAIDGMAMLPPEDSSAQAWTVACDSGTYTLLNEASGLYLGHDGSPDETSMMIKGTKQPFGWKLSAGEDGSASTHVLAVAASSEPLILTMSLLRIFPPRVAILSMGSFSTIEWEFRPV